MSILPEQPVELAVPPIFASDGTENTVVVGLFQAVPNMLADQQRMERDADTYKRQINRHLREQGLSPKEVKAWWGRSNPEIDYQPPCHAWPLAADRLLQSFASKAVAETIEAAHVVGEAS